MIFIELNSASRERRKREQLNKSYIQLSSERIKFDSLITEHKNFNTK